MSLYQLPKFEFPRLAKPIFRPFWKNKVFWLILLIIFLSSLFGFLAGTISGSFLYFKIRGELLKLNISLPEQVYLPQTSQEEAIIKVVKEASPAVVSIVVTKDVPKLELYYENPFEEFFGGPLFEFKIPQYRQKGTEKQEIGGGTGFIVSQEGMVLTNAHVVSDEKADYTILTNDGKKYPASVLARDATRDLAVMKIEEKPDSKSFPTLELGDSDKLQIGQTVIAIGNALGEFRNTVSVGVISGLGRRVTASGGGTVETLEDVIQTDAAINRGNSGGPLFNLKGEVIGVNFAMAEAAENIGFAIPINKAKKDIEQVEKFGKISYPYLGIWYLVLNEEIQKEKNLPTNEGAWITRWTKDESGNWQIQDKPAVIPGTVAQIAGLKENDIILEFNQEKITPENSLAKIIMKYSPGDKVVLKVLREGKEFSVEIILGERSE
jgi:S1-C subfamily serine protease